MIALEAITARHLAGAIASAASIAIVVWFALREREPPLACPDGLVAAAGRCCGLGQELVNRRCAGAISGCATGFRRIEAGLSSACVLEDHPVQLPGGTLPRGVADWQTKSPERDLEVAPFAIDRGEVTAFRYGACVRAKVCPPLTEARELGLPVAGIPPEQAERFCRFAGGRLPTSAEWRFAASGKEGRRFAWGFTGLVCRRAAFGLVAGPCSTEATGPDLTGARPDGQTPEGIQDLTGNVAEWTRDPSGAYRARGGSFRSRVAAELVTAAVESAAPRAPYVGFRCAYPARR